MALIGKLGTENGNPAGKKGTRGGQSAMRGKRVHSGARGQSGENRANQSISPARREAKCPGNAPSYFSNVPIYAFIPEAEIPSSAAVPDAEALPPMRTNLARRAQRRNAATVRTNLAAQARPAQEYSHRRASHPRAPRPVQERGRRAPPRHFRRRSIAAAPPARKQKSLRAQGPEGKANETRVIF